LPSSFSPIPWPRVDTKVFSILEAAWPHDPGYRDMIEIRRARDAGRHVEPSLIDDNNVVSSGGTADATWRPLSDCEDECLTSSSRHGKVAERREEGAPGREAKVIKGGRSLGSRLEQRTGEAWSRGRRV